MAPVLIYLLFGKLDFCFIDVMRCQPSDFRSKIRFFLQPLDSPLVVPIKAKYDQKYRFEGTLSLKILLQNKTSIKSMNFFLP